MDRDTVNNKILTTISISISISIIIIIIIIIIMIKLIVFLNSAYTVKFFWPTIRHCGYKQTEQRPVSTEPHRLEETFRLKTGRGKTTVCYFVTTSFQFVLVSVEKCTIVNYVHSLSAVSTINKVF